MPERIGVRELPAGSVGTKGLLFSSVSYDDEAWIEDAVRFLVSAVEENGTKKAKPIVVHSLRVGFYLYHLRIDSDVVLAGFFHDLLESTGVSAKEISSEYNKRVSQIVVANSVDKSNGNWEARYIDSIRRCQRIGTDALVVRAADAIDNVKRQLSSRRLERYDRLIRKIDLLIEAFEQIPFHEIHDRLIDDLHFCKSRLITGI